ncbi:MAG: hypothetical protein O2821_12755 [Chloroflexi bacterium]|nr:hypothetical protein [Chloroflexota bacterium]
MATWHRTLQVYVDVSEDWLMPDEPPGWTDEMVAKSAAWHEIRDEAQAALNRIFQHQRDVPRFDVDWGDFAEPAP